MMMKKIMKKTTRLVSFTGYTCNDYKNVFINKFP